MTTKDYYERYDYENVLKHLSPALAEYLEEENAFLRGYIEPGESVLEIGCGYGRTLPLLARNAKHVTGIDFSDYQVKRAKQMQRENISIYHMDATALRFPDNTFDKVVCLGHTFGNMEGIEVQVLKEMRRVAKKEICLGVLNPIAREDHEQFYRNNGFTITESTDVYSRLKEGLYSRRFSHEQMKELLVGADFDDYRLVPLTRVSFQVFAR